MWTWCALRVWRPAPSGRKKRLLPRARNQNNSWPASHKQLQRKTTIFVRRFDYENRNHHRTQFARTHLRCLWLKHVLALHPNAAPAGRPGARFHDGALYEPLSVCHRGAASRWRHLAAHRALGSAGLDPARAGYREHPLLPRPDGTGRIADGDCGFVACAVPALAPPRTFRRSREKRPGTLGFAPSGNYDGKRNRQFLIHNSRRDFGSLNNIKIMKTKNNEKLIAVIGATGQQGGGVVRALQAGSNFKGRALSRNPGKHR